MQSDNPQENSIKNRFEYLSDGRKPIDSLYKKHEILAKKYNFQIDDIFTEKISPTKTISAKSYYTKQAGPSLWIITGIHGEEPAGPNALAENIELIGKLSQNNIPLVILPLCNPKGYFLNWRYPQQATFTTNTNNASVGDSEYLLPDYSNDPTQHRATKPSCQQSDQLTKKILELAKTHPPILSIDLHEDDKLDKGYIYSQGHLNQNDPVAKKIVEIFHTNNYPLHEQGITRFGQNISGGIVEKDFDGSVDELIASATVFDNNQPIKGPSAKSVIVIETSALNTKINTRIKMQSAILQSIEELWLIAQKIV